MRCPRCETDKPKAEFFTKNPNAKRQPYCVACRRDYQRERRLANPEKERERQKEWRQKNWDATKQRHYRWRKKHPEKWKAAQNRWRVKYLQEYTKAKRQSNRDAVYGHYGEQCACCGEKERLFLTIDHVNNDGAEHRRALAGQAGKGGSSFFAWLVRENFPIGFQTLCRNCNWGKHANGGVCPHQSH